MIIENGQKVKAGEVIVKIPRAVGKAGDITGGLPPVSYTHLDVYKRQVILLKKVSWHWVKTY